MQAETALTRNIRLAVNRTGRARIVRNNVGVDSTRGVRYGLGNGSPDLCGALRGGRAFCIEVKTRTGRLRPEQEAWWRSARQWGVLGGVARSVEEALTLLTEAEAAAS